MRKANTDATRQIITQINKAQKLINEYQIFKIAYEYLEEYIRSNKKRLTTIRTAVNEFQKKREINLRQTINNLSLKTDSLYKKLKNIIETKTDQIPYIELEQLILNTKHSMRDMASCLENNFYLLNLHS